MIENEKISIIVLGLILTLCMVGVSSATIIELPLDLMGVYNITEGREVYFDLGYEFTDIYSVYMDWQGEITGCLMADIRNPEISFSSLVALSAWFEEDPIIGYAAVEGGYDYPNPTRFDAKSDGHLFRNYTWEGFYDGKGRVSVGYSAPGGNLWLDIVESGPITLDSIKIVVDGNIVPEPVTVIFLALGALRFKHVRFNYQRKEYEHVG